jgi:3-hydroxyacyl-CoA dehydrogenase
MAYDTPIDDALNWEQKTFVALNASPESRAMRYLFHAERAARKLDDLPVKTRPRPVVSVGVVGAGTMGVGIALCCTAAGLQVTLLDQDAARLAQAVTQIRSICQAEAARGRISPKTAQARIARINPAQDFATLTTADLVIEAVFEAMEVKHEVFSKLDVVCKPGAVLATNTSTLDVNLISDATSRPADVVGLHFFSPANVMKLLEVVNADRTSPEVLATAMDFAMKIGKVAAVVGVCDGFAGNRMFMNFNREAQILIEEGASPQQVDRVLQDWGLAMGPLAVMDLAGLDVGYRIRKGRAPIRNPVDPYPFTTADRLVEAGRLGQKSELGWYQYSEGSRTPEPDPTVDAVIKVVAAEKGIARRTVTDGEILERCLLQLVNTGFKLLGEGIVRQESDLDVILVNGYGFPRSKGGPMHYARETGLMHIAGRIAQFHSDFGEYWRPAPRLLKEVAEYPG